MEIFSWEYTSICAIQNYNQIIRKWSKVLRHGSSTKPLLSRYKGDNTSKKLIFWENKFTM